MTIDHDEPASRHEEGSKKGRKKGRGRLLMIACCVPMLAIALIIALSGAGFGFLVVAVMCTAMMAMMMAGMSGGSAEDGPR